MEDIILEKDSKTSPITTAQVSSHERAEAFLQTAAEASDEVSVKVYDPQEPLERAEFAELVADRDRRMVESVYKSYSMIGGKISARTPEQIDETTIKSAVRNGLALVAITALSGQDLSDFYRRVDEISNPSNR